MKKLINFFKRTKVYAIALAVVFACRIMYGHNAIENIVGLNNSAPFFTVVVLFVMWLEIVAVLSVTLSFFYEVRTLKFVVSYVALPISIINLALFPFIAQALQGADAFKGFDLRVWIYFIESLGLLALSIISVIKNKCFKMNGKDITNLLLALPAMMIACLPAYLPRALFGEGVLVDLIDLVPAHRGLVYLSFVFPVIMYMAFKGKSKQTREFALLYTSLATLITFSFSFMFKEFSSPVTMPLHLCNTAMYIMPFCILFKAKRLFYFTYFINVLGSFFAIILPNYDPQSLSNPDLIVYWYNHWIAFFMPLLYVALGVFERPKWKQFKYSMIYFAVYFVIILFINAWFTNYNQNVDFFFLNSDFIADKLGLWAENTRLIVWSFTINDLKFVFYPLYQLLFYIGYTALGFGMWFLYENCWNIAIQHKDQKRRRLNDKMDYYKLLENLKGAKANQPIDNEGKDMLKIVNFTKKYGDYVAVDGLNLEIKAGEIFGFLGHNGAGKSTTIKSLVGIQTISDGQMLVCGYDVATQPIEAKLMLGYVPDHYALYEKLTGREYVNYVADLYNVSKEDRDERLSRYVERLSLNKAIDSPIASYSHGMKQKITMIAALIHNPRVWILDEPLTGLDPTSIYQIKEIMKEHAAAGNIVFFSSHIIDVVEKVCTKIAIIRKGKLQVVKTLEEVANDNTTVEKLYLSLVSEAV